MVWSATITAESRVKPVPVSVATCAVPSMPAAGLMPVTVGAVAGVKEVTVNVNGVTPLVKGLLAVPAITERAPADALDAMVNVAFIWVEETTCTLLTVMPEPEKYSVLPEAKLVPVATTGRRLV